MFSELLKNPYSPIIKKHLYEFLKNKYIENENFINRFSDQLSYKQDAEEFLKLIKDLFSAGFDLAIEQQKDQLRKIGIELNVSNSVVEKTKQNKIF